MGGWIGVDLDGTLAVYDGWRGIDHVGDPVPDMFMRVLKWLSEHKDVRIFTARIAVADEQERSIIIGYIHDWCVRHGLPKLPVTNEKDFGMVELWDDRCVQIVPNTGKRADGRP